MSLMREKKPLVISRVVTLKHKRNPVPMYARWFETVTRIVNAPMSYDLIEGDWLPPQGKGKTADIIFNVNGTYTDNFNYNSALDVTFPNKGDGIQPFSGSSQFGSELRSEYEAPETGYVDRLKFTKRAKTGESHDGSREEPDKGANYYIRTRTVLDKAGKVISANYGKFYGKFEFGGASAEGSFIKTEAYFLNPVTNDRNIEFDRTRNLAKDFGRYNQITLP